MQDLLYLSTSSTAISSTVIGIALVENGEHVNLPRDPAEWPYSDIPSALRDGWRIVKFPETSFQIDESRNYGLGCEFILERLTPTA